MLKKLAPLLLLFVVASCSEDKGDVVTEELMVGDMQLYLHNRTWIDETSEKNEVILSASEDPRDRTNILFSADSYGCIPYYNKENTLHVYTAIAPLDRFPTLSSVVVHKIEMESYLGMLSSDTISTFGFCR